jgi:hypothetical protein
VILEKGIRAIAIPPLGAGLGGLDWHETRPRIERALAELEGVQVLVFDPNDAPASGRTIHVREVPQSRRAGWRLALPQLPIENHSRTSCYTFVMILSGSLACPT